MPKFTRDDLRPGYIVKLANGNYAEIKEVGKRGAYIVIGFDGDWEYLSHWNNDLTGHKFDAATLDDKPGVKVRKTSDIVEVYGFITNTEYYTLAGQITNIGRDLLWTKTPVKKMTMAEIEKRLGHKVEIVEE